MSRSYVRRAVLLPAVAAVSVLAMAWVGSGHAAPATGSSPPRRGATHHFASIPPRHLPAKSRAASAPKRPAASQRAKRRDTQPFWLDMPGGGRAVVYPPKQAGRQPLAVMLHGMCDVPDNECPWLAPAVTPHAWLVCPRGSLSCRGGGAMWSAARERKTVESAVHALLQARPGEVESQGATLMGFSQGAYAAFSIARSDPGQWSRLLLIAAKVYPNARRLRRHGVQRVLFAAGDYDMTHSAMSNAAHSLARRGFPARFMSLGKVGHTFPGDMTKRMTKAMAWLKL